MKKEFKINNLKIGNLYFSDCREITDDELFKINGGKQVENSNEGVANAQPGDTIIREDKTEITLNQGDIDWAQAHMESGNNSNKPIQKPENIIPAEIPINNQLTGGENFSAFPIFTTSTSLANFTSSIPNSSIRGFYDPNDSTRFLVDLDDRKSMEHAANLLAKTEQGIRIAAIGSKSGSYREFNKYSEINEYLLKQNKTLTNNVKELDSQTLQEGLSSTVGIVSTGSGIANVVMDQAINYSDEISRVPQLTKYSGKAAKLSFWTGLISLLVDGHIFKNKATFKNASNLVSDSFGFIPLVGPFLSIANSVTTDAIAETARAGLKIQENYLCQRIKYDQFINTYDPSPLPIKRMNLQTKFLIGFNQGMTQFFDGN